MKNEVAALGQSNGSVVSGRWSSQAASQTEWLSSQWSKTPHS